MKRIMAWFRRVFLCATPDKDGIAAAKGTGRIRRDALKSLNGSQD